jgi:hypothetical protein
MLNSLVRRLALAGACVAALTLCSAWNGADAVRAQSPGGAVVKVDFLAVNPQGQPVVDLKPADVSLKVGGKTRQIRTLDLVRPSVDGAAPAPKMLFSAADAAAAGYLEIYGVPKGSTVTVTLELAPSEDAPAIGTTPAQVAPGDAEDVRRVVGGFSIGALPSGDHVMRAIVSLDGKVVGRAVHTMRKGS